MAARVVLTLLALAGTARAQPAPEPGPPPPAEPAPTDPAASEPPAPPGPPSPAPPPPAGDAAWDAYDDAFVEAARGDRAAARERLLELTTRWPGHPAASRAGSLARVLAPPPESRYSKVARGELVFWSTLGGVFVAANICAIVDCASERETALVYSLSVGGSLALSLAASRNGVEQGEAQLYNSAQTWGSWNGLAINDDFASETNEAVVALASQGAGLAAGIALWPIWRPTQGDVALTNSFLLWTTLMSVWGHLALDAGDDLSLRRVVLAGDLGIVAGALLSTQVKMSRGRTLLIDVGGVLGILGGGLVAVGVDDDQAVGASLLVGTGLGLAIATLATQDWDAPAPPVRVTPARLVDPHGRGVWGLQAGFGF